VKLAAELFGFAAFFLSAHGRLAIVGAGGSTVLRLAIVLPIYFAVMFLAPRLAAFEVFAELIRATETTVNQHLIDYGAALALAGMLVWVTERWTYSPGAAGALFRVLRMGLLGVVAAAAWQIFCLLTNTEMSIVVFLIPVGLLAAELVYELVGAVFQREPSAY
jgi:hypothetical protein